MAFRVAVLMVKDRASFIRLTSLVKGRQNLLHRQQQSKAECSRANVTHTHTQNSRDAAGVLFVSRKDAATGRQEGPDGKE